MKHYQRAIPIASILAVSIGMAPLVTAQSPDMEQTGCPASLFEPSASVPGSNDPIWREEFAGIDLSGAQVQRVRELKATLDREAFGTGFSLERLIEWANAGEQGEEAFQQSPIAAAIRNYNAGIQELLTPTQYQQWVRNGGGEQL